MILNPENVYFTTTQGKLTMIEAIGMSNDKPIEIACLSDDKRTVVYKELDKSCFVPSDRYLYRTNIDGTNLYLDKNSEILTDKGIPVKVAYMIHGISLMKDISEIDVRTADLDNLYGAAVLNHIEHTAYNLPSYDIKVKGFYPIINDIFMV